MFWRTKKESRPFVVQTPNPKFGKIEQTSATWLFIETWAKNEINSLRKKNDALGLSEQQTTVYRSQIKLLKRIIEMPNEDNTKRGPQ